MREGREHIGFALTSPREIIATMGFSDDMMRMK
jgi:hypothetical protein